MTEDYILCACVAYIQILTKSFNKIVQITKIVIKIMYIKDLIYMRVERTAGVSCSLKASTVGTVTTCDGNKFHWVIVYGKNENL